MFPGSVPSAYAEDSAAGCRFLVAAGLRDLTRDYIDSHSPIITRLSGESMAVHDSTGPPPRSVGTLRIRVRRAPYPVYSRKRSKTFMTICNLQLRGEPRHPSGSCRSRCHLKVQMLISMRVLGAAARTSALIIPVCSTPVTEEPPLIGILSELDILL